jgi:uncharacterized protein (TIGR02145 family)
MKKFKSTLNSAILFMFIFSGLTTFSQKTVFIGTQEWMTKNLEVTTFRNGDSIPQAKSEKEWVNAGNKQQPAWCYYLNDPVNGVKYGIIYNWWAVNDPRGLAPKGWRIPNDEDFSTLLANYQNNRELAYAVFIKGGISGLNFPLGGWRGRKEGDFKDIDVYAAIWSLTEKGKWVSYLELNAQFQVSGMREAGKGSGCYVRCIREE